MLEKYKDFGGIRIEDDILVTNDGCRVLGKPIPKTVKLRSKINNLYSIMISPESRNKHKRASRWALTYFFDDQDLIFDEMPVLGLVDDLIVVDKALSIIDQLKK